MDTRSEKIGYKIREAQGQKIPYMLIAGAKEEEAGLVSVRSRFAGDEGQRSLEQFIADIKEEIASRVNRPVLLKQKKINKVGVKKIDTMIPDCSVLRTPAIFKTFVLRSFFFEKWLLTHVLACPKFKNPRASFASSDFQTLDTGIIK